MPTKSSVTNTTIDMASGVTRLGEMEGYVGGQRKFLRGQIWALPHRHCINSQVYTGGGASGGKAF